MKTTIFLIVLFYFNAIEGQNKWDKPNYKQIKKDCSNIKSNFYYDSLFARYLRADTNINLDEKRHLYYGFQFTKKYSPYGEGGHFNDSLRSVMKLNELTSLDYRNVSIYCDSLLVGDPMNLKYLSMQANVFRKMGDSSRYSITKFKLNSVIDAILSSGDGETEKSAYYVIAVAHEYSILKILGYEYAGKQSLIGTNDLLKIKENENNLKGIYFDVTSSLTFMENLFKKNK